MQSKSTTSKSARVATWLRRNYPQQAPEHGHCYLLALCGTNYAGR